MEFILTFKLPNLNCEMNTETPRRIFSFLVLLLLVVISLIYISLTVQCTQYIHFKITLTSTVHIISFFLNNTSELQTRVVYPPIQFSAVVCLYKMQIIFVASYHKELMQTEQSNQIKYKMKIERDVCVHPIVPYNLSNVNV